MKDTLIINGALVNEGSIFKADILIQEGKISKINRGDSGTLRSIEDVRMIDANNQYIFPGVIDDQVHFREPGLTHKADIHSEARSAVAGGVTSFMEMPNTVPNTLTQELLEDKYEIAAKSSLANYSFFMGASNDNIDEVLRTDPKSVCGVKIFMGSSTGNMLVDNDESLDHLFSKCKMLIATHCEDEATIRANSDQYRKKYGENVPMSAHPLIRSEEACYLSSLKAVQLATKHDTHLHILHISTKRELELFSNEHPLTDKRITAEACIHHLWFTNKDYDSKGSLIKWNPAVKSMEDRDAILEAVKADVIDVIATDHAPHTKAEKEGSYFDAPSGGPLLQHSLVAMLELHHQGKISLETIANKMCHSPALLFEVHSRGFLREGYSADLVIVDLNRPWTVNKSNITSKCNWSPFEGEQFRSTITHTMVNGHLAYSSQETPEEPFTFDESIKGQRLSFDR
ncbi:MAG TPA: dihydroorotase [Flavobacteriales bacterium]|nr:dihydroorotase [Flavobacteriales bacterium]